MSRLSLLPIDTLSFLTPAVQERSCSERSTSSLGPASHLRCAGTRLVPRSWSALPLLACRPPSGLRARGPALSLGAASSGSHFQEDLPHPPHPRRQPRTARPLLVKRTRHASSGFDQVHFPHVLRARKANSPLMEKNSLLYLHDAHLIVGFIFYFLFFSSFSSCL